MNIQEIFENAIIEKQKRFIQAEFSSVEIAEDEDGVITLKLTFNDLTEDRMTRILETVKDYLR